MVGVNGEKHNSISLLNKENDKHNSIILDDEEISFKGDTNNINKNDYKLPLLKRVEKHNNIDSDGILNNQKPRKRKTMYPKDWSDE